MVFIFVSYQRQAMVAQAFAALGCVAKNGYSFEACCLVTKMVSGAYSWETLVREELPQEKQMYRVVRKVFEEVKM